MVVDVSGRGRKVGPGEKGWCHGVLHRPSTRFPMVYNTRPREEVFENTKTRLRVTGRISDA